MNALFSNKKTPCYLYKISLPQHFCLIVRMIKAQEEPDIDSLVDSIMNQYEDALKDLVDL